MKEIIFTIPYLPELSKNKKYADRTSKRLNSLHRQAMQAVAYKFERKLIKKGIPEKQKCYIEIYVYRPNMRGDPCNFVDAVCDALCSVLPFNDNYFAVNVDWEVDKYDPKIEITFRYT